MEDLFYCDDGSIQWYSGGCVVRANGPCEIGELGGIYFSQLDINSYNRKNGPCLIYPDGRICYTAPPGYHRTTGPAIIYADGRKEYWVDGRRIAVEEFFAIYRVL